MTLLDYEGRFSAIRSKARDARELSQAAMLMAVIGLIEDKVITGNRIAFDQTLLTAFKQQFHKLAGLDLPERPELPFFQLGSSGFWHHQPKPGKADAYHALNTVDSPGSIEEIIHFASLDDALFELLGNGVARELLKSSLQRNLTDTNRRELLDVGSGWDWLECEATVQDYFSMLHKELLGEAFSKTGHRRALMTRLDNRGHGAIEYKHQNVSAILLEMGQPYIKGYKPAFNYQQQLKRVVLAHIAAHPHEFEKISKTAELPISSPSSTIDWNKVFDPVPPERIASVQEPKRQYLASKTNYTERELANRILGESGERFVIAYEQHRLEQANRGDLAKEVEWSSRIQGDGLGYDIRSFVPERDEELFIEVKTTNSGKHQPFFISENEVAYSREREQYYRLYRVYDFRWNARIFELAGAVDRHVQLQPHSYRASFHAEP